MIQNYFHMSKVMNKFANNVTNNNTTISWMPEPNIRGTFHLLTSCLVTLSLCVYTAVHLNVPPKNIRKSSLYAKKLKWILFGMFAPELVVFTAWSQWMSARKLTQVVNKCIKEQGAESVEWTMQHSFFAQMGGFAFDTNAHGEQYIPESPRLYLTANGAAALAQLGRLPQVSGEFIADKSKADSLAKGLVIIQAGWLIVECIGRTITGLPITLLELNTLAHVVCALIMYGLWWYKPLDISDPVILKGDWVPSLCAAMWMFSRISTQIERDNRSKLLEPPEIEKLIRYERQRHCSSSLDGPRMNSSTETGDVLIEMKSEQQDDESYGRPEVQPKDSIKEGQLQDSSLGGQPQNSHLSANSPERSSDLNSTSIVVATVNLDHYRQGEIQGASFRVNHRLSSHTGLHVDLESDQVLLPIGFGPNPSSRHFRKRDISRSKIAELWKPPVTVPIDRVTLARWRLAIECLDNHPEIWERHKSKILNIRSQDGILWTQSKYPNKKCQSNYVDPRIQNWPKKDLLWNSNYLSIIFFIACGTIYGGLHVAAWNGYFPTATERLLWRISAVYIGGSAFLYPLYLLIGKMFSLIRLMNSDDGLVKSCSEFCIACGIGFLQGILLAVPVYCMIGIIGLYIFARSFLVIEAFISFRALPLEMYEAPRWSQYLSHL